MYYWVQVRKWGMTEAEIQRLKTTEHLQEAFKKFKMPAKARTGSLGGHGGHGGAGGVGC